MWSAALPGVSVVGLVVGPRAVAVPVVHPSVRLVRPADGATDVVPVATPVTADLRIPNGGVDARTLTAAAVYLYRVYNNARVPGLVNTSGGGDAIVFKPSAPLRPHATYAFVVTAGVRDLAGVSFAPFRSTFRTGPVPAPPRSTGVSFAQVPQAAGAGRNYFGLAVGPDRRLYAGADDGRIYRFDVRADGSLAPPAVIDTIRQRNGGVPRFVVGLAFAPGSTAADPVLYVTHAAPSGLVLGDAAGPDWTGKVSVLSGANLGGYRDAVVHLPRSVRDHLTDQPAFGPDGALYFCQASQSAMGAADVVWGNRAEHPLSGAILRLDVAALGGGTVDARTPDGGGTYDPAAPGAPLTVYADGVRNSFDLVWHRNGRLYAPTNGSAAGGNTPAGPGVPAITGVTTPETDYLFRVDRGGYYGHPNPKRGHHVLNGGNPTAGWDPYQVPDYPVGTPPDPAWRPAIYDFGYHKAPAGAVEYKGPTFGGALDGRLVVCQYSGGDNLLVLTLGPTGNVVKSQGQLPGLTGLADPVDVVQGANGRLYVIELAKRRITLLKPQGG